MVNGVLLRKLLRDLGARKGSLAVLVLIVMVGVGSYLGMAALYRDLDGSRGRYYEQYHLRDFTIQLKRAPAWAIAELRDAPNIREIQPRVGIAVRIDLPAREKPVNGTAISVPVPRRPVINDLLLRTKVCFQF